MYTAKHALLYKHHVPDGEAYVFYIDIRAGGKGYEEFIARVREEERVNYIRGKVSKMFRDGDKIVVWGVDTLTGEKVEIEADLVVLAMAIVEKEGVRNVAQMLKVAVDKDGFFKEAHPKLRPVEALTKGIYLAGAAQAPKDIPEAVAQASGAAAKVVAMFSKDKIEKEPLVAVVDEEHCSGCKTCISVCPYGAMYFDGNVAKCREVLCEGCGTCAAACPSNNIEMRNLQDEQIKKMIEVILR